MLLVTMRRYENKETDQTPMLLAQAKIGREASFAAWAANCVRVCWPIRAKSAILQRHLATRLMGAMRFAPVTVSAQRRGLRH